jgi:hypothetical protein
MVLGYGKQGLSKTQVVQCVFGPHQLAEMLGSAERFRLETSEFDEIIKWIKGSPKPEGATSNVHGSVPVSGQLQKRDATLQDSSALRHVKSWRDYFRSEEYLAGIGVVKK